jgi:hypothetical protein
MKRRNGNINLSILSQVELISGSIHFVIYDPHRCDHLEIIRSQSIFYRISYFQIEKNKDHSKNWEKSISSLFLVDTS